MTVNKSPADITGDAFAYLYPYKYMQLTTFRKNGTPVNTPVWFAPIQGKLYVMTIEGTGKVKRIRNNGRVMLSPSDQRGKVLGTQIEAQARMLSTAEYQQAIATLVRKYGLLYRIFTSFQKLMRAKRTFIEIEPI